MYWEKGSSGIEDLRGYRELMKKGRVPLCKGPVARCSQGLERRQKCRKSESQEEAGMRGLGLDPASLGDSGH